jgi:hypothetical protein
VAAPIACWKPTALGACSPRSTSSASAPKRTPSRRSRGSGTRSSEPPAAGGRILAVLHHPLVQHASPIAASNTLSRVHIFELTYFT